MDVLDVVILASMGVVALLFACYAVWEWWDTQAERERLAQRPDAQVIQHRQSDSKMSSAA
jgi:hypothetical protein